MQRSLIGSFILRWAINFLGLWAAASLLAGVDYGNRVSVLVWAALIFSLVNAAIRPLVILLSLPAIVLSLGLFIFVVNALMLYLVTVLYPEFHVATFGQALLAVVVVWVVNYVISALIDGRSHEKSV